MIIPTKVFDAYWYFAAERLSMYQRRLHDSVGPWTTDPILRNYRFTNTFRASDRVSQYLIEEVQYRSDRSQRVEDIFFRTMLFKIFNKIETWELIEDELGPVKWKADNLQGIDLLLGRAMERGQRIYSAAYIMPSPNFGRERKHSNHLALIRWMMAEGLPKAMANARSLKAAYEKMLASPGLGPFLAFQYTIDLNYSAIMDFDEDDYVVAGPGAHDGISKCFANAFAISAEEIIYEMVRIQDANFSRLNLNFDGLFGRKLKAIDCQNIFCEISKYARVAFPDIQGKSGRTRIKQSYRQPVGPLPIPYFPPKWNLQIPRLEVPLYTPRREVQGSLF